jgi:hypothetical protein
MRWLLLFFLFASLGSLIGAAQQPDELRARFLAEAPRAWEKYLTAVKRFQGSYTFQHRRVGSGIDTKRRHEVKQASGCALRLEQSLIEQGKPNTSGRLSAANPQYWFDLSRSKEAGSWRVVTVHLNTDRAEVPKALARDINIALASPVTFAAFSIQYRIVVNEPGFDLRRVESNGAGGKQAVKVSFHYTPKNDDGVRPSVEGWIIYDPEHYWVIQSYEAKVTRRAVPEKGRPAPIVSTTTGSFSYAMDGNNLPLPIKHVFQNKSHRTGNQADGFFEYDLHQGESPAAEFTLPNFGFSHPEGYREPSRIPWYIWTAVAGFVAIGGGYFVLRRSRTLTSTKAAP